MHDLRHFFQLLSGDAGGGQIPDIQTFELRQTKERRNVRDAGALLVGAVVFAVIDAAADVQMMQAGEVCQGRKVGDVG